MIADDLFAGAGGWDLAAADLGIHARGIENMPQARATRDAAGLTTIHDDVWTYRPDGNATGLIASPPCQTFSQAGSGAGRKALEDVLRGIRDNYVTDIDHLRFLGEEVGDERTALVLTPLHFALTGGYEWLAWEQVPTVLPVWEACADRLRADGWNVWTGFLHSEQYGVPQTRKRAKLLASRFRRVEMPTPTHSRYHPRSPGRLDPGVKKWVSMAEALGGRPGDFMRSNYGTGGDPTARGERAVDEPAFTVTSKVDRNRWRFAGAGQTSETTSGQRPRELDQPAHTITGKATAAWVYRSTTMANSARRPIDCPAPTIAFGHDAASAQWIPVAAIEGEDGAEISWPFERPSPTIVGSFHPEVVAAPGYRKPGDPPRQKTPGSVRVTVSEAAVLQSFPADYPWQGRAGKQYMQVGNAVPVGMARAALSAAAAVGADGAVA